MSQSAVMICPIHQIPKTCYRSTSRKTGKTRNKYTCLSCVGITNKTYRKNPANNLKRYHFRWRWKLKTKYGLTPETFNVLMQKQNYRCAICQVMFGVEQRNTPQIDHNHETKVVRGLLCHPCNSLILPGIETAYRCGLLPRAQRYLGGIK